MLVALEPKIFPLNLSGGSGDRKLSREESPGLDIFLLLILKIFCGSKDKKLIQSFLAAGWMGG